MSAGSLKDKVVAGFFAASLAFPALMGASPANAKIDYEGRSPHTLPSYGC